MYPTKGILDLCHWMKLYSMYGSLTPPLCDGAMAQMTLSTNGAFTRSIRGKYAFYSKKILDQFKETLEPFGFRSTN